MSVQPARQAKVDSTPAAQEIPAARVAPVVRPLFGERVEFPRMRSEIPVSRPLQPVPSATGETLRCVCTSPDHGGQPCQSRVPVRVMREAWRRELRQGRAKGGFFRFAWNEEMWLGYGVADGNVRGAYCPTHAAQRDERLGYDPDLDARNADIQH